MSQARSSRHVAVQVSPRKTAVARRPAVWVAICLMLGIAFHRWLPTAPAAYLLAGLAVLLAAAVTLRRGLLSSACLLCGFIACGIALAQVESFYYAADDVGLFTSPSSMLAELELVVQQSPKTSPALPRAGPRALHQRLDCGVRAVRTHQGWRACSGELAVWLDQAHPAMQVGSRFRAIGELSRPRPAMNPGEFDWAEYSARQRIRAAFRIHGPAQIVMLGREPLSILQYVRAQARRYFDMEFAAGPDHDLLEALLLGEHGPELRPIQENFQQTGTSHHLATSGMHIAVLTLLVYGICRLLCWPPRRSAIIALAAMLLYGAVVVPSPPIMRSILLAGAIGGGILLRRRAQAIQLLALALVAMLVIHPLDLYSAGFQLSFIAVAALMLLSGPLGEMLRRDKPDGPPPPHTPGGRITGKFLTITATGLAAWLACAPLVAWHFRQFNPYAIAAGALLEPLVFISIIAGALKIVLTALLPYLASLWAGLAIVPTASLRWSVGVLAMIPGTDWMVASPPAGLMALWYVLICLPLWLGDRWRRVKWLGPAAACAVGGAFLLFARGGLANGTVRVCILSVGPGQCVVAELPGGHAAIFDAGSEANTHLFDTTIEPYLRFRAIHTVDAIFISHPNIDHFNAVEEMVRRWEVRRVYLTRQFLDDVPTNPSAAILLRRLSELNHRPLVLAAGDHVQLGSGTVVNVLWPNQTSGLRDNDASLVLALRHAGRQILLCGDIQAKAQRLLLADPALLRSDVLIAPHHGSTESATADFIRAVNPLWIVSSNDHTLSKKQRNFEVIAAGQTLYRTDRRGAVTVTLPAMGAAIIEPFLAADLPDRFIQSDADGGR